MSSRRRWTSSGSPTSSGWAGTAGSATRAWRTTTKGRATARDVLRDGIFWTTDLLEAANELVPLIRDRRPQVLITYNQFGGYGHPDHIQAHRVAMYGVPAGRRAELPARPGCGLDGVAGAVEHHEPQPDARRDQGAARGGGHRDLRRASTPTAGSPPMVRRRRRHRRGDRRHAVGRAEAGRDAGARHPDHRGRAVLRRGDGAGGQPVVAGVLPCSRPACRSRTPTAGPTTSSPGWTDLAS